jgi:hypothetical protein
LFWRGEAVSEVEVITDAQTGADPSAKLRCPALNTIGLNPFDPVCVLRMPKFAKANVAIFQIVAAGRRHRGILSP